MEIKAKCKYDSEAVKSLVRVAAFKKDDPKVVYIVSLILDVLLFVMTLVVFFVYGWMNTYYLMLLALLLAFLMNYTYFVIPEITFRRMASFRDIENEFVFRENLFVIYSKNGDYTGEGEMNYSAVPKVIENSKYFFVYQNKSQAYIVDKSTLEGGSAEELRFALQSKIGGKYIICRY